MTQTLVPYTSLFRSHGVVEGAVASLPRRRQRQQRRVAALRRDDRQFAEHHLQSFVLADQPVDVGHAGAAEAAGIDGKDDQRDVAVSDAPPGAGRSAEHTSELQSLTSISYAVLCLTETNTKTKQPRRRHTRT